MALALTADYFDLWVFRRTADGVEYLLFRTSQEKADRFFGGGRFWQIPTDAVRDDEHIADACRRLLKTSGVGPGDIWSADFVYTIYNRRYDAVCAIPVFAAAAQRASPALGWEHSDFGWYDAEACLERIRFRGLRRAGRGQGDDHGEPAADARAAAGPGIRIAIGRRTMRAPRDYDDIPGTYVQDSVHLRKGYHLNMFCLSLNHAGNREAFRAGEAAYLDRFPITPAQRRAVLERDWLELLRLGGNIYYTFKLAACDGLTMQHVGAEMSGTGMTVEDFRRMMLDGGRPVDGNRSRREREHG